MEEKTYGQVAFEAYRKDRNAVAYDSAPIPEWNETKPEIRKAWEAAGNAVADYFRALAGDAVRAARLMGNLPSEGVNPNQFQVVTNDGVPTDQIQFWQDGKPKGGLINFTPPEP